MTATLVLDSGVVMALVSRDRAAKRRAQGYLQAAWERSLLVRAPTAALAEVYRGGRRDAAIDKLVRSAVRPITTGLGTARLAGALLARHRLDSCHLVDAVVVATTVRLGGGVVLTSDPADLDRLAAGNPNVIVRGL
ncbi:MAG: PIN domain-containing protein [Acidimicrobiales bacterium]